ncbi:MAG: hypothetical protein K0U29_03210 [Gammaproteobacteria bacterium]|nr:hypothetical protein [Gammaproteobacteria bacterium]
MKKSALLISAMGLIVGTSAFASPTIFTTQKEALQHCPAPNVLKFTPIHPTVANSAGVIQGVGKDGDFESYNSNTGSHLTVAPKSLQNLGASFRNVGGYGRITGNVTLCYYSYTGALGNPVAVIMRNH